MTLVNFCGAESGDLTEIATLVGTNSASTAQKHGLGSYSYRFNPTAATSYGLVEALTTGGRPTGWNIASGYVVWYYYPATLPGSTTEFAFIWGDIALTKPQVGYYISSTGGIVPTYFNGSGAGVQTFTTGQMVQNSWNEVRIRFTNIATTNGASLEWWLNGLQLGSTSGVTVWTAPSNANVFTPGNNFTVITMDGYFDDITIATDDYYPGSIINRVPNATGSSSQWTNGAGTSPTNIAEVPNDGDTGYITSSTINNVTTVNITDLTGTYKRPHVRSVKTIAYLRDLTATDTVKVRDLSNGTTSDITSPTLTTGYLPYAKLNDTDPNTSAAWTPAAVDALEIGVVDGASIAARCTALYAMVLFDENFPTIVTRPKAIVSLTR